MIAYDATNSSVIFVARGQPWSLASDHPNFGKVRELLVGGCQDEDRLIKLVDVRVAVSEASDGRVSISEDALTVDGEALPEAWRQKALREPDATRVLIVKPGDRVRVEGDEDAPDGEYTVGDVDNGDIDKRIYVESEDDYFGFVANTSIKEILASE
jgi:hypothetical protein